MDGNKSVLHYAIQAGNLPAVRALVGAGANVNQASTNRSPVTIARSAGHHDIVKFLQMKGGNDSASLAGQAIRPSWSLTSLDTYAQTRRMRALESADRAPEALIADPYGTWESTDHDFIASVIG
jgi:ankyrin repeat protein